MEQKKDESKIHVDDDWKAQAQAESRLKGQPIPIGNVPNYLSSAEMSLMSLDLVSATSSLLVFHPVPHVRAEAQKRMAKETMETITDLTARFIISESAKQGKLEPFQKDTEAEKAAKRRAARYDSLEVESLRLKAHKEAWEKSQMLNSSELQSGKNIRIVPGPAMSELLEIAIKGFR